MEQNDTPRGLKIKLGEGLKIIMNDAQTQGENSSTSTSCCVDVIISNNNSSQIVSWFGEAGGELWGYWSLFKGDNGGSTENASHISKHIILQLMINNANNRDIFYIVGTLMGAGEEDEFLKNLVFESDDEAQKKATTPTTVAAAEAASIQNGDNCQTAELKKLIAKEKTAGNKLRGKNKSLETQLEVLEDQLEQLSEAFDEVVNEKDGLEEANDAKEQSLNGKILLLEAELEKKVKGLEVKKEVVEVEEEKEEKEEKEEEVMQTNILAEKWKQEANIWKKKCDVMSNDIKRLLKNQVNPKRLEELQHDLDDTSHELESYQMALKHALSQVEEMRIREHALLGNSFEHAQFRAKPKSYVNVGRNIVKMRKRVRRLKIPDERTARITAQKTAEKAKVVRKKVGRTWGKVKRGVGIKKNQEGAGEGISERRESFFDDDVDDNIDQEEAAEIIIVEGRLVRGEIPGGLG